MTSMLTAGVAIAASVGLLWYGYDDEGQQKVTVAPAPGGATVLVTF
jgi:hypothetical protein